MEPNISLVMAPLRRVVGYPLAEFMTHWSVLQVARERRIRCDPEQTVRLEHLECGRVIEQRQTWYR